MVRAWLENLRRREPCRCWERLAGATCMTHAAMMYVKGAARDCLGH